MLRIAYKRKNAPVQECKVLRLSRKDKAIFMDALLNPPIPSEKLRQAASKYISKDNPQK